MKSLIIILFLGTGILFISSDEIRTYYTEQNLPHYCDDSIYFDPVIDSLTIAFFGKDAITVCEFMEAIDSFEGLHNIFNGGVENKHFKRLVFRFEKESGHRANIHHTGLVWPSYMDDSSLYNDVMIWMRYYNCKDTMLVKSYIDNNRYKYEVFKPLIPKKLASKGRTIPIDSIYYELLSWMKEGDNINSDSIFFNVTYDFEYFEYEGVKLFSDDEFFIAKDSFDKLYKKCDKMFFELENGEIYIVVP